MTDANERALYKKALPMTRRGVPNAFAASTEGTKELIAKPKDTAANEVNIKTRMKIITRDGSGFKPTILKY